MVQHVFSLAKAKHQALITPHAVALATTAGKTPQVRPHHKSSNSVETSFLGAVSNLLQLLDDSASSGHRLDVVVSDFWARPLIIPMQGKLPGDDDIDAILTQQYRRTYGDLITEWNWCWTHQENRLVAVAWPAAGLKELREGLLQRDCVLTSATPFSTHVANWLLSASEACWLAIIEQQSITMIRQQGGFWEDWCVIPCSNDSEVNLPLQLERELARRRDACRQLTLVNLSETVNINLLRKNLLDSGWSLQIRSITEAGDKPIHHLSLAILAGATT